MSKQEEKKIIEIMTSIINNNIRKLEEGKTIFINTLPDCLHKSRLLNIASADAKICVIAMLNEDGTWQAYIGYPDVRDLLPIPKPDGDFQAVDWVWFCENISDVEGVKLLGDKLPEEIARQLFIDGWEGKEYKCQ